jgi:hypothetical protein
MMRRLDRHDSLYWYGDMDFVSHFRKLLGLRSIEVLITIQPKIEFFAIGIIRRDAKYWPRTAMIESSAG